MVWLLACSQLWAQKQIAITFDDAPRPDSHLSSEARTAKLLAALQSSGVEQAMFFVTTKHLNADSQQRLDEYHQAGHLIANHSDQHLWLHKTDVAVYQQDFMTAHKRLKDYPHFRPMFRFPFLDEGRDQVRHDAMKKFLQQQGYQNAYVTVDNYDWYLDHLFQQAIKGSGQVDMQQMKKLYVDVLSTAIQFSDDIAMQYLGRSPKHVLLLHDNDLAAYFIDDLVTHLKANGWQIISTTEAYQDPIATQIPDTLFNGQGRVAALARVAGAKPRDLVHVAEDEVQLKSMFEAYQVVKSGSKE